LEERPLGEVAWCRHQAELHDVASRCLVHIAPSRYTGLFPIRRERGNDHGRSRSDLSSHE
ncbi:MAG: hypothetical protein M3346_05915, partial [Actinomycetota bacterium]|nr:hypothetical protein [Actinomycetota bacterium]